MRSKKNARRPRAAEFFAGAGLVRAALESAGWRVVFANDIDPIKRAIYTANFGGSDFVLGDVAELHGRDVPTVELATASFPCTDLSLAGGRAGLNGHESGLLWHFLRILDEMGDRRPPVAMLENVPGFATSNGGEDLRATLHALNELGYDCDVVMIDARHFVPQSRQRVFIIASLVPLPEAAGWRPPALRPAWLRRFVEKHPELRVRPVPIEEPPTTPLRLSDVVERLAPRNQTWWEPVRLEAFLASLSPLQAERLEARRRAKRLNWATAYRRTRGGRPVWEIRADDIAGCLRTTRGGSSKQAVVEAGRGNVRVRWMTAREYARLQGADALDFSAVTESQARFALGDAVCVPAVRWLAERHLVPLAQGAYS